jgi:hypothetical protein
MATSRRNFLKTGGMGLVFFGLPAAALAKITGRSFAVSSSAETGSKPLSFTRETFARHLNTVFYITTKTSAVKTKLTTVTDLKAISKNPERIAGKESFSLFFVTTNTGTPLSQDTYTIEHDVLGKFSLFLVPVGRTRNTHYEAIISRL